MKIKFCVCGWRINIWTFILDSLASAIWYFCFVSTIILIFLLLFSFCNLVFAFSFYKKKKKFGVIFCLLLLQNLVFWLFFNFCNLVFMFCLCNCFSISSSLQFLQKKNRVIFCLLLLQNLVFRLSFNFYNLVFLFCLCNCFDISSSLQFLQFSICVQFLQKKN